MSELKPCPFCGGKATSVLYHNRNLSFIRYFVKCQHCLVATENYEKRETAIKAWNRRADNER